MTLMKLLILSLSILSPLSLADETLKTESIDLSEGTKILTYNDPIVIDGGYPVPHVMDWNGDGKKDLLIGQRERGGIRLYLNKGTDPKPIFEDFNYLEAQGVRISLPSG